MVFRGIRVLISLIWMMAAFGQGLGPGGGRKLVAVTALTGSGSWEDPRRPAVVVAGAVNYRWTASDDGRYAIVLLELERVSADGLRALDDAVAGKGGAVKVFERGRDKKEDVEREIKRFKKDFDLEEFLGARKIGGGK